jgi:hypothetical protein
MKQVNDQYPDTDPDVVKSRIIEIRKLSAGIYLPVTKITKWPNVRDNRIGTTLNKKNFVYLYR